MKYTLNGTAISFTRCIITPIANTGIPKSEGHRIIMIIMSRIIMMCIVDYNARPRSTVWSKIKKAWNC